jgi:hypothetical protein
MGRLWVLFWLFVSFANALVVTNSVQSTIGSDNNSTSLVTPFMTLQHGDNSTSAADTKYVVGGTDGGQ